MNHGCGKCGYRKKIPLVETQKAADCKSKAVSQTGIRSPRLAGFLSASHLQTNSKGVQLKIPKQLGVQLKK